jgi:hypothetical protein
MKRRYDDGGEILEALNSSDEAMEIAESVGAGPKNTDVLKYGMREEKAAKPKAASKAKPKDSKSDAPMRGKRSDAGTSPPVGYGRRDFEESQRSSPDKTKMSVSERAKATRESARSGSGSTDKRSVNERIRSAMGMKNGGSASSRADGIATKGKTRGKIC